MVWVNFGFLEALVAPFKCWKRESFSFLVKATTIVPLLMNLVKALSSGIASPQVKNIRQPVVLNRNAAASGKRKKMAEEIASFARGHKKKGCKIYAVAHRDCDATEPAHVVESSGLEAELRKAGVENPIAATPAWEMETWLMLFPAALQSVRPCWKQIDYGSQHVGLFEHAKERLTKDLQPHDREARKRCPEYREEDSIRVAEQIARNPEHLSTIRARSDSFNAFRDKIRSALS